MRRYLVNADHLFPDIFYVYLRSLLSVLTTIFCFAIFLSFVTIFLSSCYLSLLTVFLSFLTLLSISFSILSMRESPFLCEKEEEDDDLYFHFHFLSFFNFPVLRFESDFGSGCVLVFSLLAWDVVIVEKIFSLS